ncbi:HAD family hydrolase [Candidatus Soleaferrea massiliensis]|uniref:HAD family hydrolase n=1 Tax=Candidatus Soleaferrea massiliensis TaxID=1470354 RepID=UPI00058E85E8|nr:HAD family phosphatase [Candidatus Soleaferrea massiliensis]
MKEKKVGVIFDFNGTLFDDAYQQEKAWRTFAREVFNREITQEEMFQHIHGRNNRFIMEYLAEKKLDDDQVDLLVERKETRYRSLCRENPDSFYLAAGAVQLLDELKVRGIPRTIATASRKSNVDFYIESFALETWFQPADIVYDDGSIPGKPEPDFYLRSAQKIGIAPKHCIVAEDAVSGIQSAWRAGIGRVVAVAPENRWDTLSEMKEVSNLIENFYAFDRSWLEE